MSEPSSARPRPAQPGSARTNQAQHSGARPRPVQNSGARTNPAQPSGARTNPSQPSGAGTSPAQPSGAGHSSAQPNTTLHSTGLYSRGRANCGQQEGTPAQTIPQPHCQPTYAEAASGKRHLDPSAIGETTIPGPHQHSSVLHSTTTTPV